MPPAVRIPKLSIFEIGSSLNLAAAGVDEALEAGEQMSKVIGGGLRRSAGLEGGVEREREASGVPGLSFGPGDWKRSLPEDGDDDQIVDVRGL